MSYARSFVGTPKEKELVDNSEFLKLLVFHLCHTLAMN